MQSSTRARVFVDTNVLFSAFHSPAGAPALILRLHIDGLIQLLVSPRILVELVRTVEAKLPSKIEVLGRLLAHAPPEVIPDPTADDVSAAIRQVNQEDAPIWAAALNSEAEYFVTGDRRLLREARAARSSVTVVTPRELIDLLDQSKQSR